MTVMSFVDEHPVETVYEIVTTPDVTPVTTPVEDPTVAILVLELDQWPPVTVSASVIEEPTHTVEDPVIVPGKGTIVTFIGTRALRHPPMVCDT